MRRRHSSAVEQLFRKSPALCAVLPRVEGRYKRAHLSAIRFEGMPVWDRRCGPLASKPTLTTPESSQKPSADPEPRDKPPGSCQSSVIDPMSVAHSAVGTGHFHPLDGLDPPGLAPRPRVTVHGGLPDWAASHGAPECFGKAMSHALCAVLPRVTDPYKPHGQVSVRPGHLNEETLTVPPRPGHRNQRPGMTYGA